MARLRNAPATQPSPPRKQPTRQALKEKTNTARAKATVYEDDGNTEGLVKEGKARRGRPKKAAQREDDYVMAGGLGQAEDVARNDMTIPTTDELAKSDAPPPPTAKANRRPPRMTRKPIQNEAQSKVLEGLKKRMDETARKEAGGAKGLLAAKKPVSEAAEPSSDTLHIKAPTVRQSVAPPLEDISIYDSPRSPPPPGKLRSVTKRSSLAQPPPTSVMRPHATPGIENSVLRNFKRRPRQPSMLAMVQQRTTGARPSAVNAHAAEEDPSIYDFDLPGSEPDDEDDFAPEAEGTPLQVSKAKRMSVGSGKKKTAQAAPTSAKRAAPNRKRKSDEANLSSGALESLKAKKSKSGGPTLSARDEPAVLEPASSRRKSSTETERRPALPHGTSDDVQVINSSQSTPPPSESTFDPEEAPTPRRSFVEADYIVPSTEAEEQQDHVQQPEDDGEDILANDPLEDAPNGTVAEPASSSPTPVAISSTQQRRAEELADPVTQVSPPPERPQRKKEKQKPMSTATLQSLLPKRRQPPKPRHRKSEYDFTSDDSEDQGEIDGSHLDEDEDELSGRLRRPTKPTPAKARKSTAPPVSKAKGRQSKAPPTRKKAAQPKGSKRTVKAPKPARTYGRAANTASDKENQGDEDGSEAPDDADDSADLPDLSAADVAKSSELEAAKRKFAEVDEWDMEFESLGDEEHRSSSQQWR